MIDLTTYEILIRLLATIIASSFIGYERERKGHDAGLRTHVMVAIGACVFALIQVEIAYYTIDVTKAHPDLQISVEMTRIVAQVVSGVGFLGAGTIIMTKQRVRGLTTAASIWATAALGVGFGMGFFLMMTLSTVMIMMTLVIFKKIFKAPMPISFEIRYKEQVHLSEKIVQYFKIHNAPLLDSHYLYELKEGVVHHVNQYTIDSSRIEHKSVFFEGLFTIGNIDEIKSLYLDEE